jgi:hypothetical protein
VTTYPLNWREAKEWIKAVHRHHVPPQGMKWATAVVKDGRLVGVATCGRPVSRIIQQAEPLTFEVTRVATDGTKNACSALYADTRRQGFAKGYNRGITYILASEPGTSLKAAGWKFVRMTDGGSWDVPSRRRTDKHPTEPKQLWECRPTWPAAKPESPR